MRRKSEIATTRVRPHACGEGTATRRGKPAAFCCIARSDWHERSGEAGRCPARTGGQGSLRDRRDSAARPCAEADVRLGHPQGAPRHARHRHAGRGGRDPRDRSARGADHGDGRRRQLQRRVGGAGQADLSVRLPQGALSHRRLGCLGHRLGGGRQGEALEGRRRSGGPLQPGRRRRRGVQRRRPDVLAQPAHLGLRDPRRLLRPVRPRPGAAADAPPQAPDLGRERLLHPDARHRLPHAVRPPPAHPAARPQRAGVGRGRRPGVHGDPADRGGRRQRHRRHLGRGQARLRPRPGRQGRHQPQGLRLLGPAARRGRRPGGVQGLHEEGPRVRQGHLGHHRQGQRRRFRVRAPGRGHLPGVVQRGQARRHGGVLRRHHRLQPDLRRPLRVDAPEAHPGQPLRQPAAGRPGQPAGHRAAPRSLHVRGVQLGRDPRRPHEDAEERAQAGQHGGAGPGPEARPPHRRGLHRGRISLALSRRQGAPCRRHLFNVKIFTLFRKAA
ncbi:PKS protein (fragment) [Magnetospirillum sp. UT-4]